MFGANTFYNVLYVYLQSQNAENLKMFDYMPICIFIFGM